MKVQMRDLKSITPYHRNPRRNDAAVDAVAESIQRFGFRQPIVVDRNGVIVVGHTRYKAALKLGLQKVPVHVAEEMTEAEARAYRIADNRTADIATWDEALLREELPDLKSLLEPFFDDWSDLLAAPPLSEEDVAADKDERTQSPSEEEVQRYVQLRGDVQYKPTGRAVTLSDLADETQYRELLAEIDAMALPGEVAQFLRLAATRFIRFDFENIAEYYAQADALTQRSFERLVLVILDYDDALKRGLISLAAQAIVTAEAEREEDESE